MPTMGASRRAVEEADWNHGCTQMHTDGVRAMLPAEPSSGTSARTRDRQTYGRLPRKAKFAQHLRETRIRRGLSVAEVAEQVGSATSSAPPAAPSPGCRSAPSARAAAPRRVRPCRARQAADRGPDCAGRASEPALLPPVFAAGGTDEVRGLCDFICVICVNTSCFLGTRMHAGRRSKRGQPIQHILLGDGSLPAEG